MKWKKEKPIEGGFGSCLCCPVTVDKLSMNTKIIAGFGMAQITKNDECIYDEEPNIEWDDAPTLMKFENMARKDPDNDWQFELRLPLRDARYQRHGRNCWVLVERGLGFA